MKGIKLVRPGEEDLLLSFKSKIELKDNSYYQYILGKYHEEYKSQGAKLICQCNNVEMSCRFINYYFLANLQVNSHKHSEDCIYYDHLEELTDKEDKYKSLIFKEPILDFSKADDKEKREFNEKSNHRRNTFVNFCTDLISESMAKSFNIKNKNVENRGEIKYPEYNEFLRSFNNISNNNTLLQKGSIKDSLDKYYNFSYGVINYDFLSQIQLKQKEYDIFLPIKIKQYDEVDNTFIGYKTKNIDCKINFHTLKAAAELVKNFTNYIASPYFFIAIYKQNQFNKKIVRLFLHPVYSDDRYLVFVDSGYERKYAKKLINGNVPFMKPILDSCFYKINGKFVNYTNSRNEQKRAFLQFLPDFIEFTDDNIFITEVSGYDNIEYQNLMKKKSLHYESESIKSNKLYKIKVVDGKSI